VPRRTQPSVLLLWCVLPRSLPRSASAALPLVASAGVVFGARAPFAALLLVPVKRCLAGFCPILHLICAHTRRDVSLCANLIADVKERLFDIFEPIPVHLLACQIGK
jgi:hypothetical protein